MPQRGQLNNKVNKNIFLLLLIIIKIKYKYIIINKNAEHFYVFRHELCFT